MLDKLIAHPLTYLALALIALFFVGRIYRRMLPDKAYRSLPAILIAGAVLLAWVVFKPAEPEPPAERLEGELIVPAYEANGTPFVNYMKFPIKVEFRGEGQWSVSRYPDSVSGPAGQSGGEADSRRRLASAPHGSLIMQRPDTGQYEPAGRRKVVELKPGEKVLFLINDYKPDRAYADNTGTLNIYWTCFNCLNR